jgi:nitrogen fixation/metabolism regulation signal transduction histidine kinase
MHKLQIVFWYCGRFANKLGNNLRISSGSFAHNTHMMIRIVSMKSLYTYFEQNVHNVLHTNFQQFSSVKAGYTHASTGPTTITTLYINK